MVSISLNCSDYLMLLVKVELASPCELASCIVFGALTSYHNLPSPCDLVLLLAQCWKWELGSHLFIYHAFQLLIQFAEILKVLFKLASFFSYICCSLCLRPLS